MFVAHHNQLQHLTIHSCTVVQFQRMLSSANSLLQREMLGKLDVSQSVEYPDPPLVAGVLLLVVKHIEREEGWEDPLKHMGLDELVARVNVDPVPHGLPLS